MIRVITSIVWESSKTLWFLFMCFRTNLPKEIMQIPDFPFRNQGGPSFVHHSVIRQYLLDYAKHFNLYPYIKVGSLELHKSLNSKSNYITYSCLALTKHFFISLKIRNLYHGEILLVFDFGLYSAFFLVSHRGETCRAWNFEKRPNIVDADVRGSGVKSTDHENFRCRGAVQRSLHRRSRPTYSRHRKFSRRMHS